jgi:hypothetical protein
LNFLAQQSSFFSEQSGTNALWVKIVIAAAIGFAFLVICLKLPVRMRRPVVATVTFIGGLYWVVFFFWPEPILRDAVRDEPANFVDSVGFFLSDANPIFANVANILAAFILGLGVYSLMLIHAKRVFKGHPDAFFSIVLLLAILIYVPFGYVDWYMRDHDKEAKLLLLENWGFWQYGRDFLFDGMFQVLDGAMFSMIAFFILSAAYRAFRIRSIESTILLATALIVMLTFMGVIVVKSDAIIESLSGQDPASFWNNFRASEIRDWLQNTLQQPGIRALDFGLGLGALALGLRLWLNLERRIGGS